MTTIYDQFMQCKKEQHTYIRDNYLVHQKLMVLFHMAYGIDLSPEEHVFTNDISSIGQELSIDYKFKYGKVNVCTEVDKLVVTFFHGDHLKAPFNANRCTITVDHDLNFIKAEYCMYFAFLNSVLHNNGGYGGYNQVKLQRIIDLNGAHNDLAFRHSDAVDDDLFVDVERSKLDERFLKPNIQLEEFLFKAIDFVTENPHDFYETFDGYPSFSKCVDHSDGIIDFINVFVHQYFNDNERLKENLLLIDMQTI